MRDQKRNCEATKIRADGVVLVKFHHIFLTNTTPAPIKRWATPLDYAEEGDITFLELQFIHTFYDRARCCGTQGP